MAFISLYNRNPAEQQQYNELFAGTGHTTEFIDGPVSLQNLNSDAEVIAIFVSDKITRNILEKLPKLQLIATQSTSLDHIDLAAAKERGITIVTVPPSGERAVAEYTFALILAVSRRIGGSAHSAAFSSQVNYDRICGFDLEGKTLGIVGSGRIGQHVAKIANGFGMNVIVFDPHSNETQVPGFHYVSLAELARQSDIISLHAPATKENYHLVDSNFLASVKSSAVLVNTAHGELVDLVALVEAFEKQRLWGAALDVLEHEELLQQNLQAVMEDSADERASIARAIFALKRTRDVLITPHNAGNSTETISRIQQATAQNIIDFYKGRMPNKVES